MRVLVVEDESKVLRFVREGLEAAGMTVDAADNTEDMLEFLRGGPYDAMVLDRMLDRKDSLEYLPAIRKIQPQMKILFLSALSEVEEKVRGLSHGADDYLGKPFHVAELVARLRAVVRRSVPGQESANHIAFEDLKIDLDSQSVLRASKRIDLTGKEFRILVLLARHPGKIFSKSEILDRVWDLNHNPGSNVVEVTVANLRAKIENEGSALIHSRRGQGYWLGKKP